MSEDETKDVILGEYGYAPRADLVPPKQYPNKNRPDEIGWWTRVLESGALILHQRDYNNQWFYVFDAVNRYHGRRRGLVEARKFAESLPQPAHNERMQPDPREKPLEVSPHDFAPRRRHELYAVRNDPNRNRRR